MRVLHSPEEDSAIPAGMNLLFGRFDAEEFMKILLSAIEARMIERGRINGVG